MFEVEVSGWDVTEPLLGDSAPVAVLAFGPAASDPLADAAELGTPPAPPARTELREYIDDTDMRLEPISDSDGVARSVESGSEECLNESSGTLAGGAGLEASTSSTAKSSLFVPLGLVPPNLADSALAGFCRL